jgi:hypothetical protein
MLKKLPKPSYRKIQGEEEEQEKNVLYTITDSDPAEQQTETKVFQKLYTSIQKKKIGKNGVDYIDVEEAFEEDKRKYPKDHQPITKDELYKFQTDIGYWSNQLINKKEDAAIHRQKQFEIAEKERRLKELKENHSVNVNNGSNVKDLFVFPSHIDDLPKAIWNNMFFMLPGVFLQSIRYHKYIIEIFIRYQPKINTKKKKRTYASIKDHISEAQEAGLIFFSKKKISDEYMLVEYTFLDFGDEETREESTRMVEGESLNQIIPDEDLTPTIEDILKVNMILIYNPEEQFTEKTDERNVKYGCLFFVI